MAYTEYIFRTATSDELTLVADKLYSLEVVMVFQSQSPEFSLGFQHVDSGLIQNPIGKEHLVWQSKSKSLSYIFLILIYT